MSLRLWELASKSGPPSMSGRGRRGPGHARARHVRIQLYGVRAAAVVGLGLAIAVAPFTATAMSSAPAQHSGIASAVNNRSKLLRRHNPVGRQADQSFGTARG